MISAAAASGEGVQPRSVKLDSAVRSAETERAHRSCVGRHERCEYRPSMGDEEEDDGSGRHGGNGVQHEAARCVGC